MISSKDLQTCIDNLAEISNGAPRQIKVKALEIGYILKKELDIVAGIEQMSENSSLASYGTKGLINDNVQLFHENQKLLKENMELKRILESRITSIASTMNSLKNSIEGINEKINSFG